MFLKGCTNQATYVIVSQFTVTKHITWLVFRHPVFFVDTFIVGLVFYVIILSFLSTIWKISHNMSSTVRTSANSAAKSTLFRGVLSAVAASEVRRKRSGWLSRNIRVDYGFVWSFLSNSCSSSWSCVILQPCGVFWVERTVWDNRMQL